MKNKKNLKATSIEIWNCINFVIFIRILRDKVWLLKHDNLDL